jgi:hypothetical protein
MPESTLVCAASECPEVVVRSPLSWLPEIRE